VTSNWRDEGYCVLRIVAEDILYREDDGSPGWAQASSAPGRDTDRAQFSLAARGREQKSVILWAATG
jgi:hypothetical protein